MTTILVANADPLRRSRGKEIHAISSTYKMKFENKPCQTLAHRDFQKIAVSCSKRPQQKMTHTISILCFQQTPLLLPTCAKQTRKESCVCRNQGKQCNELLSFHHSNPLRRTMSIDCNARINSKTSRRTGRFLLSDFIQSDSFKQTFCDKFAW
jgi:hypothetical protein